MNSTASETSNQLRGVADPVKMESPCGLSGLIEDEKGRYGGVPEGPRIRQWPQPPDHGLREIDIPADLGLTVDQLQAWYQEYMDAEEIGPDSDLIQAVRADNLDRPSIKRRVQELAASVHVFEGLCSKCRHDFENWPDPPPAPSWEPGNIGRAVNTLEIETAAIAGCRYCAL